MSLLLGPRDLEVVEALGTTEEEKEALQEAFEAAWKPWSREAGTATQELSEAYTTASYFYAISKDAKRKARVEGSYTDDATIEAQFVEDYMEGLVKALDKSLMVSLSLARHGG
jgi:hypothetical protein